MDDFRNGSLLQLQSKSNRKMLAMQEGGVVSCDGTLGYYNPQNPLIALSSHVIGRLNDNRYCRGVITEVGPEILVAFENGDSGKYNPSCITAVIHDITPCQGSVQVHHKVLARKAQSSFFFQGTVDKIDYMNPSAPRYYVNSCHGDPSGWFILDDLRIMPVKRETVGAAVYARCPNKFYYHGTVTECSQGKLHISFDSDTGQTTIAHYVSDIDSVLMDRVPNPVDVLVGARVIAPWMFTLHYFSGYVTDVDPVNVNAPRVEVTFDDGGVFWVDFGVVRMLPMSIKKVGTVLWSKQQNNLYQKGKVEKADNNKIQILLDDGKRISHLSSDVSSMILNLTPNKQAIAIESRVIAEKRGKPMWYPGTVRKVDSTNPFKTRYFVEYDDRETGWALHGSIRLIPVAGPNTEAQFSVVEIGSNIVALQSLAFPQYFLGIHGSSVVGKELDKYCHMYVHKTSEYNTIILSFCMFPGHYLAVSRDGELLAPNATHKPDERSFEVKCMLNPNRQSNQDEKQSTAQQDIQLLLNYPPPITNGAHPPGGVS